MTRIGRIYADQIRFNPPNPRHPRAILTLKHIHHFYLFAIFHPVKSQINISASQNIDKEKWNRCVNENENGLIYSSTQYLDSICDNWHGLVVDDYAAVMALPWRKKIGIRYGYIPPFIQQLGLIGDISNIESVELIKAIQQFISFADIHFNFSNISIAKTIPAILRTNLVIDLSQPLDKIRSAFKKDTRENIRKAETQELLYTSETEIDKAISLYQTHYGERMKHIHEPDYNHFLQLSRYLEIKSQCFTRQVTDENGNVLSIGLFLKDEKRIYNLMNTTVPEGRNKEANYFLLDRVIAEFAGQSLLFDMEGSELPGVRAFYEKFGAVNQPYFYYHYNGLPWLLRLLKR
jgi:hypothetical protein